MARLRTGVVALSDERLGRLRLELMIGQTEADLDELEVAWELLRDAIMSGPQGRRDGRRPWAWWHFDAGEEMPERGDEPVRLAQLGELTREEFAALREKANEARLRVGTSGERIAALGTALEQRPDREAVELLERVEAARQAVTDSAAFAELVDDEHVR